MAKKYPAYLSLPRLQIRGSSLFLHSPFLGNALLLFSHARQVHFSNFKKQVKIKTKMWWQWQRPMKFRYNQIDYIDLTYLRISEDEDEMVIKLNKMLLITRNPFQSIVLATFGGGEFLNPVFQKAAEICADTISEHTGLRFGLKKKEVPLGDFQDKYICKNCGHRLHPDAEIILCKYCGGKEIEIVAG